MKGKRGLSPVIAVLLLILITVAAVTLVATFLIPFVKDTLNDSTECVDYKSYFTFEENFEDGDKVIQYNCYDSEGNHGASIKAGSIDAEKEKLVDGFDLVFIKEGSSEKARATSDPLGVSDVTMLAGGAIEIPSSGELRTYVYSSENRNQFDKVEVHAVLKSGRVCEASDSIKFIQCDSTEVTLG